MSIDIPPKQKRNNIIAFKVTDRERRALDRICEEKQVTISDLVRHMIFGKVETKYYG
jgi:hypothetical protein